MRDTSAGTLMVVDRNEDLLGLIAVKDIANANMDILDNFALSRARTPYQNVLDTLDGKMIVGNPNDTIRIGKLSIGTTPEMMDGRMQYVVELTPKITETYALWTGRLYVDRETLAFTKIDLSLDMRSPAKVTAMILRKKPFSLRFTPHELSLTADYTTDGGVTRLNYIRNVIRFRCDWKRRLFKSNFNIVSEMVVTDRQEGTDIRPIRVRDSFFRHDNFYDKVIYFNDPDFWGSENIIEPTEDLLKGIDKIKKKMIDK
jgi:hypothetical protein